MYGSQEDETYPLAHMRRSFMHNLDLCFPKVRSVTTLELWNGDWSNNKI